MAGIKQPLPQALETALAVADKIRFFHWFLEFPEVFFGPRPGTTQVIERLEGAGFDAVVGNPPYIRQEEIPRDAKKEKGKFKKGTKEYYLKLVKEEGGVLLSGRSDIHCYFWPHAASFLKDDGRLCLLTSSQWLDVEYGFRLQAWILDQFEILAVFESIDEPWFVGARVATTVTIAISDKAISSPGTTPARNRPPMETSAVTP